MKKSLITPDASLYKGQCKDSKKEPTGTALNPQFEDLGNPETFTRHIVALKYQSSVQHAELLQELLTQFEPVDFTGRAYPDVIKLREDLLTL